MPDTPKPYHLAKACTYEHDTPLRALVIVSSTIRLVADDELWERRAAIERKVRRLEVLDWFLHG
jgi:hypothetical protein